MDKPLKEKDKQRRSGWRAHLLAVVLIVVIPALAMLGIAAPGPLEEVKTTVVPRGANVHAIASLLEVNGAIYHPWLFRLAAKLGAHDSLKAGEYQIAPHESIADIVHMMHEGQSVVHLFTVAEGLTSAEVMQLLNNVPILTGAIPAPPEGSLLPESYRYSYGDMRESVIARMQKDMQDALTEAWAKRDPAVALKSPQEAVVLASIVEKETGKAAERPRIAAVFYNRLKANMRLQSDPTVIYAIVRERGLMDHDLDHHDLEFPSPYNTYMSDGLPPHPICNPGRAALEAVLHPETNDYLYFVADGTGGHVFSRSLDEHNQNVAKWARGKR